MPKKEQKQSKLRQDRQKNIEIVLSRLKISNYAISQALLTCDSTLLNSDIVDQLVNIMPDQSEASCYDKLDIDRDKLAIPDLFFLEIIKVPAYDARLQSLQLLNSYKESIDGILGQLRKFTELSSL